MSVSNDVSIKFRGQYAVSRLSDVAASSRDHFRREITLLADRLWDRLNGIPNIGDAVFYRGEMMTVEATDHTDKTAQVTRPGKNWVVVPWHTLQWPGEIK